MKKSTLVIGVIGAGCHIIGNKVLDRILIAHDFHVINLGAMVGQGKYIDATTKTGADAIVVSSTYGHGDIDCLRLHERCIGRGLDDIPLYVDGSLVVDKHDFADVEVKSKEVDFSRVPAPSHGLEDVCTLITNGTHQHNGLEQRCLEETI